MSNNDSLIIQPSDEIISHTALLPDMIVFAEEQRQELIQILRQIPAILELAKKLSEGKSYRAIIPPEALARIKDGSAKLIYKGNGHWSSTIRDAKTGYITDHASLMEDVPDLLGSLNQLATQQTLADIVYRLEVIDEKITGILQGQINDRLAEVKSGIHIYEQAMDAINPENRSQLLRSAIVQLTEGRDRLIESTDFSFIVELPRTRTGMFFCGISDIPNYVQSKAEPIWKAAHAIIKASRYLVMAYSALNEPHSLRRSLEQVDSEVKVFQDKMGEIVNMLPPTSNWRESLTTISQGVLPNIRDLDGIPQKTIVVEFLPKEITPSEGVQP